ncbi:hypothetical protein N9917_01275 [Deltaproteobacteria bacterium]|nr:hypothetical protein [Deltaproteobacteria bacterium]
MRVVADLASHDILQVEKDPPLGLGSPFNGRFSVPIPSGSSVQVTKDSVIGGGGPNDVWQQAMNGLLAQYPMYEVIAYNPLLDAGDNNDIDLAATGPGGEIPRLQMGRGTGSPTGMAPNSVALLPYNTAVAPPRPGALVTEVIDLVALGVPAGADEFLVWWKLYQFSTTEDIMSDYGASAGVNQPSARSILEMNQDVAPPLFEVFITHDDGATWTSVERLDPTDLVVFDTRVRLAFLNRSGVRLYLAGYAILF